MTGIRSVAGFGRVDRGSGNNKTSMSQLPVDNNNKLVRKPSGIIKAGELDKRFGAGMNLTIDRSRDVEPGYDLGMREVTVISPGMYELGFSLEGYVSVTNLEWLEYLFQTKEIEITSGTKVYDKDCNVITNPSTATGDIYLKNSRGRLLRSGIPVESYLSYLDFIGTSGNKVKIVYCDYPESPEETMFDIAYIQSNTRAMGGKVNEIGILCGCMIESGSISYEAGSDYGIKFSLNGFALREYLETATDEFFYQDFIRKIDSDILAVGCLSVGQRKGDTLEPISYTDSASFTVNNTLEKIPECNEITYGGATIGTISYELSIQTYSNDPNRYINAMLGYEDNFIGTKTTDVIDTSNVYRAQRVPRKINAFKIRSSDDYGGKDLSRFIDIFTFDNVVTGLNKEFDVDNRIMDDPTILPLKALVAYGYNEGDITSPPCTPSGTSTNSTQSYGLPDIGEGDGDADPEEI